MLSVETRSLGAATRARLETEAGFADGASAFVARRAGIALGFGLLLSLVIGAALWGGVLMIGEPGPARSGLLGSGLPAFGLGATLLVLWITLGAARDARTEHDHRLSRTAPARASLTAGEERLVTLDLDESAFRIRHEHGALLIVSDSAGGAAILSISTIADDPLADLADAETPPRRWRWVDLPNTGRFEAAPPSGPAQRLRTYDGALPHADALESLLGASVEDPAHQWSSARPPAEIEDTMRAQLGPPVAGA